MTGWLLTYVFNAVWQVPVVFGVAWLLARLYRAAGPWAGHRVWVAAVLLEVLLPACPDAASWRAALRFGHGGQGGSGAVSFATAAGAHRAGLVLSPALGYAIVALYGAMLLLFAARLVRGVVLTAQLRRSASPVVLCPASQQVWQRCRARMNLRRAALAESERLRTPVTFGLRDPVIVFPAGLLPALDSEEVEAILAHEAAHIARHDFAGNLILQFLTLPIRFHPVLWLTMGHVIECREMVCDTLASNALHSLDGRSSYARSLLRLASALASLPCDGPSVAAPNAIGIFDAHTLERRIMNLTQSTPRPSMIRRAALAAAAFSVALVFTVSATALRTTVSADPVRVGGGVMAGEVLSKVAPRYPQAAKDAHVQGTVVLRAIIGKDGAIDQLSVVSGPPELTGSALEAVRQWKYKPYLLNGEPTEVDTTITVNYALAN